MSAWLARWVLDDDYAEFVGVTPGAVLWTVHVADSAAAAMTAALESGQDDPLGGERLVALCQVGEGLYGTPALVRYLAAGLDPTNLLWDYETSTWMVLTGTGALPLAT